MDEQALEPRHRLLLQKKGQMSGADYSAAWTICTHSDAAWVVS